MRYSAQFLALLPLFAFSCIFKDWQSVDISWIIIDVNSFFKNNNLVTQFRLWFNAQVFIVFVIIIIIAFTSHNLIYSKTTNQSLHILLINPQLIHGLTFSPFRNFW